jgi:hypothetical protein
MSEVPAGIVESLDESGLIQLRDEAIGRLAGLRREAAADAPLPEGALKRVPLPSGAIAIFYQRKGRALIHAQRAAGDDTSRLAFALLAQVVEIDGRQPLMEDIEDMDLPDVLKLQEEFGSLGKPGPQPRP